MRPIVPVAADIRLVQFDRPVVIGEKRNIGCELAGGEVVAHWDDDDISAPGRLADQVQRMLNSAKPVTGYNTMRFTDGARWWQYRGMRDYALGTSLCYRKDWWASHRFECPPDQVGEDNRFVFAARRDKAIVSEDAGDLMYATIHAGNTSPRNFNESWIEL